jgi:parallel beta-helix repeat protein
MDATAGGEAKSNTRVCAEGSRSLPTPKRIRIPSRPIYVCAILVLLAGLFWISAEVPAKAGTVPTYNVKNYGAVGNGTQDDTNAIQAAINAVDPAAGGTVYVPNGVYLVRYNAQGGNTSLNLKSNMTFQMDAGAEIKLAANNSGWYQVIAISIAQDVTITGGTITGDRTSHTGATGEYGYGISIWNSKNITIDGVKARDCWGDGFFVDGTDGTTSHNVTIQNCTYDHNRRQGLTICDLNGGTVTGSTFINTKGTSTEVGIDLEPYDSAQVVSNITISGNTFRNNLAGVVAGGAAGSVSNVTISGNTLENNTGGGMWIDSSRSFAISSNIVRNNGDQGIELLGCPGFNVNGNQVYGNQGSGIRLEAGYNTSTVSTNCTIQYNTVTGNAWNGIELIGGSTYNSVTGNNIWGNGGQPIYTDGTPNNTIAGNSFDPNNPISPPSPDGGAAWYFAEGYTGVGFSEVLCLGNPQAKPANVIITYMFNGMPSVDQSVLVPASSRVTVDVNSFVGPGKSVSCVVRANEQIVAERAMYFNYNGAWTGGSDTLGAAKPSQTWYFAEGYTGPGFEEYICILNPGDSNADLTLRFQTQEAGEIVKRGLQVPAHSRQTFRVNDLLGGSYQTSLKVESSQAIVAERPMYFSYASISGAGSWTGGHVVMGASSISKSYYFAEGTTRPGFEEYLTLQNPNSAAIQVDATYLLGNGQGSAITRSYRVGERSRLTVFVPEEIGWGKDVSVKLSSSSEFLAERPMYFDYHGEWDGGHDVLGATTPATTWFFAEGYTGDSFNEWLCLQNPGNDVAEVTITYYPTSGTPTTKPHTVSPNSRLTVNVNDDAGSSLEISARVTSDEPIVAERPMYFAYRGAWTGGHDAVGFASYP